MVGDNFCISHSDSYKNCENLLSGIFLTHRISVHQRRVSLFNIHNLRANTFARDSEMGNENYDCCQLISFLTLRNGEIDK